MIIFIKVIWGILLSSIAGALTPVMPINKNLWSVSFIFLLSGGAFILLTLIYILVDYYKWWSGNPFIYVGMNSIVVYMGSELFQGRFPFGFSTGY